MDKDKIQEIRDYAEAAANLMPYEDDDVIFSGIEIMELLDHLASKEAEVERLREALEFYANSVNWWWDSERNSWIWMGDSHPDMTASRALAGKNIDEADARMAYYELTEKLDGEE